MLWYYHCPQCGQELHVDWDEATHEFTCPECDATHHPPLPGQDQFAYVGTDRWPKELENAVVARRGSVCSAPGCFRRYSTLVHRVPIGQGGRTSVDNLLPMCGLHARDKGQRDYDEWLSGLKHHKPVPEDQHPAIELTASQAAPDNNPDGEPDAASRRPVRFVEPLLGSVCVAEDSVPGARLVGATPFLPGPARRLVLEYELDLGSSAHCDVILSARPFLPPVGGDGGHTTIHVTNHHPGNGDAKGPVRLELRLPSKNGDLWVAAVFVRGSGDSSLRSYLLAATD